ncbi:DUF2785 domain-containing protein [Nocardioides sp. dk4132]|uniref:DUF2785 domain-containing protein n=1 Tax=unclassified Nocardioides TaxID=2615069 RepID=UPI001297F5D8|nr:MULTISPECIES: DUF2785 domain-containing protein [unclassified Nocardioides]MQW75550.1 DUF2785 domain-containing protein [Nocardioides sp. dk4132]QGA08461.1 DUF2785 domain-containing protein [Nocardioides sp. dk884]
MSGTYWRELQAQGLPVPSDRSLHELSAELTAMLGDPDPAVREGLALPAILTWLDRGVYDDLMSGLGDGMALGLSAGLGESGTDTVFRRSLSARVLGACLERGVELALISPDRVLDWGDRLATWFLREQDLRGFVPGKGRAHAVAHGADALGSLAGSSHLGAPELTVVLDVLADRLLLPTEVLFNHGEPDRLAAATIRVLHRDLVPLSVLEPWVARIAARAGVRAAYDGRDPYLVRGNAESFLRALYLQLALGPQPPPVRADLLLIVVDALRATNPDHLRAAGEHYRGTRRAGARG